MGIRGLGTEIMIVHPTDNSAKSSFMLNVQEVLSNFNVVSRYSKKYKLAYTY